MGDLLNPPSAEDFSGRQRCPPRHPVTQHGFVTFRPMSVHSRQTIHRVQINDVAMLLHFHPRCVQMCMIVPPSGRCRPSASATRPTCRRGPACTWSRAGRPTTRPARCPSPTCTFEQASGKVSIKDVRMSDEAGRCGLHSPADSPHGCRGLVVALRVLDLRLLPLARALRL